MPTLPLEGLTVLEFTHAVMGPTTGLLLADMGAEVINFEPPEGDSTRRLKGFGSGYFSFYNRNKKSLAADLKTEAGKALVYRLAEKADIVVEATGNALEQALKCVTPGGKVLPFGMDSSITTTVVPNEITRWATKIIGLYLGQNTMVPAIRIFQEKRLNVKPFFTKVIPLEEGLEAFGCLGLDPRTMQHQPKSAMKIVMKM